MPRIKLDVLPDKENIPEVEPDLDSHAATDVFEYSPEHKWWYFNDMKSDEAIVFKLYDSDQVTRVPHAAFHDSLREGTKPRESVEIRTIVCYK